MSLPCPAHCPPLDLVLDRNIWTISLNLHTFMDILHMDSFTVLPVLHFKVSGLINQWKEIPSELIRDLLLLPVDIIAKYNRTKYIILVH